jgi:two-component system sensor histidine kinase PhoQ
MPNSLFGRLLTANLILLCVFFSFLFFVIQQSYIDSLLTAKQEQLQLQASILVSTAIVEGDAIALPNELGEPRFNSNNSGLYGYVSDINNTILWSSYSAKDLSINKSLLNNDEINTNASNQVAQYPSAGDSFFRSTADYYIAHYYVEWELIEEQPQLIAFTVLEKNGPTLTKIADFQHAILRWFITGAITLIIAVLLILRWGTTPLNKLAHAIKDIESGKRQHIEGNVPIELQGLTNNLNALIDAEKQQRERYHNSLADLAHSLKTPLAVIQNELDSPDSDDKNNALIAAQTLRMKDIIAHQLQRAVVVAPSHLRDNTAVDNCVHKICSALNKVYRDKNLTLQQEVKPATIFKGDQRDLMEVLGNLCDNACKACRTTIKIYAYNEAEKLFIEIHDDGPGIAKDLRHQVINRGQRLDTTIGGQGIGLDVVRDIVELYDGKIAIEQSPLGGALFKVYF